MPVPSFSDLQLSSGEFLPLINDNSGGRPAACDRDDYRPTTAPLSGTHLLKFGRSVSCQALSSMNDWKQGRSTPAPILALTESQLRCTMDADVNAQLGDIVRALQPNTQADADRSAALIQIEIAVQKSLGAKVFPHGSFALKTYLPDADLNLCAFFTNSNHKAWGQRALKLLARDDTTADDQQQQSGTGTLRSAELIAASESAGGKVLRGMIGSYTVEISANAPGVLSSCALFEEVDRLVDQNHLFKRAIILTKAWARYEAQVLNARHGLLSSYAIRTMVLFVFNAFHRQIRTPLDALLILVQYLDQFDWSRHVFGLFGPIHLSSLPQYESVIGDPCSWPPNAKPLISKSLLSQYAVDPATTTTTGADAFTDWTFNLIDPRNPAHNLGSGLSGMMAAFVKDQLCQAARRSLSAIAAWGRDPDPRLLFARLMPGVLARLAALGPIARDAAPALDADLDQMQRRMAQASEFDMPDIKERDLVQLMVAILQDNDSVVTVGKMGSLMHSATNNHALPAMLKTRYGGLKKLLRRHEDIFAVATDHPHNPHVMLLPTYERALALWSTPDCSPSRSSSPSPAPSPSSLFAPIPQHTTTTTTTIWTTAASNGIPPRPASVPVHSARRWGDETTAAAASLWSTPAPIPPWFSSLPDEFFCPITGEVMRDPVVASDGVTYDRASLEDLRQSCRAFSPLTGLPLDLTNVYPNLALKSLLVKIRSQEFVIQSRPTGALSRIGHYYERCASIWG